MMDTDYKPFDVPVSGNGETPYRHHWNDAGHDLYSHLESPLWLEPGDQVNVPCGVAIELPDWTFGLIVPRSSTLDRGLHVVQGVIDPGYRGELFARVIHVGKGSLPVTVRHGERLAQLLILPNFGSAANMVPVRELASSERGEAGFGSSGR